MWAVVSIITVSRVLFEDLPVGVKHVLFSWQNLKSRSETYHLPTVKVTLFGNTNTRLYTPVRAGTGSLVTGDMLKMPLTSPHNTPWVAPPVQHAKTVSTSHFSSLGYTNTTEHFLPTFYEFDLLGVYSSNIGLLGVLHSISFKLETRDLAILNLICLFRLSDICGGAICLLTRHELLVFTSPHNRGKAPLTLRLNAGIIVSLSWQFPANKSLPNCKLYRKLALKTVETGLDWN